jgi:hypothetical protein
MTQRNHLTTAGVALATLLAAFTLTAPAFAQYYAYPAYTTWQPDWDAYRYDQHHVMLGIVTDFAPYRLTVQRRNGIVQTVDLKNGTRIFPTGATPSPGERVALLGYYSNGTFIVNRVILRS